MVAFEASDLACYYRQVIAILSTEKSLASPPRYRYTLHS